MSAFSAKNTEYSAKNAIPYRNDFRFWSLTENNPPATRFKLNSRTVVSEAEKLLLLNLDSTDNPVQAYFIDKNAG